MILHKAVASQINEIFSDNENIIGACAVNYSVNEEYNQIDWKIKTPAEKISTIHAFCVHPDVIDTNDKAMKLYVKAGFEEIDRIEIYRQ